MKRLLESVGVDEAQWRPLVVAFLKIDFAALRGAYGGVAARRTVFALLTVAIVYGLSGIMPAVIAYRSHDLVFGATVMTTVVGFMVLSTLLAGEGVSIVSPDDHMVLGSRPVSSRTYLAVRLTTLCLRTAVITALTSSLPVAAFLIRDGGGPAQALAAVLAAFGAATALTLGIVVMYGWLLRAAGPARLMRLMSYTHITAQFVTFGGLILAMRGLLTLGETAMAGTVWMFLFPPAWFASYVALSLGQFAIATIVPAVLSLALLAVLASSLGGKLSLEHGEQLARLATAAAPRTAPASSRWMGVLRSETRAVAILVRSQFRHDLKFRLGILALLPVSVVYMYIGSDNGGPADPFLANRAGHGSDVGLIQLALFFLPTTLRRTLVASDAFRASWIFHASPADRPRLVLAARDIITIFFLVPYLLVLAGLFAYFFGNVGHALVHAFFLGCLSYLVLQLGVLLNPQLPLSQPPNKDTTAGLAVGLMIGVSIVGMLFYMFMIHVVYRTAVRMAITFVCLVVVAIVMDRWTRARVRSSLALIPADGI